MSALSILHSTVLCGMVRLNQPNVLVRRQASAQIHGPTQTEPSPQGPLPRQRANAIVHNSCNFILSFIFLATFSLFTSGSIPGAFPELESRELGNDHHAAFLLGVGEFCASRNRGGGPPIVYGSLYVSMCQKMVVSRRITATRAILEPRRCLILRYQFRIFGSLFRTCKTSCPRIKRAVLLPCLVMEPNRS